ncbi:cytochrome P450 [Mycena amicta]|nr:cytochrome P450 [Mycena amicta]
MDSLDLKTLLLSGLVAGAFLYFLRTQTREWKQDKSIPAIAHAADNPLSYYLAALRFFSNAQEMFSRAYTENPNGVFRFARPFRWEYVVTGPRRVAEIAGIPEEVLSFHAGAADSLQTEWTLGAPIRYDPWHVYTIRGSLTRNLSRCFPEVRDEIVHSFEDVLALDGKEWKNIQALPTCMKVVSRTSNRLFVGLPLCRDPGFLKLSIDFTISVFSRGQLIALIPEFMKPLIAPMFSAKNSTLRYALKFLGPLLQERLEAEEKYGKDRPDRPNDLISWLLDFAPEYDRTVPGIAMRIMAINMAAIHTSSTTIAAALFDLAAYPEHIAPMREEAERVVAAEGWTKVALNGMHKIDSFLRESQRLSTTGPGVMGRQVMAPEGFKFADGTTVPYGAFMNVAALSSHLDEAHYENANTFDGFRFSRLREAAAARGKPSTSADEDSPKVFNLQMVSTAPEHVVFGHGRHACPGRFFAATELKAMLAHMLIEYDIEAPLEGAEGRPKDMNFGLLRMPSGTGEIRVRKRQEVR